MKKQPEPVTEVAFMTKVKSIRGIKPLIEKALLLYVLITDGDTPRWVKAIVIGALAYLINPVDYATTRVFILKFGNSRIWKVGNSIFVIPYSVLGEDLSEGLERPKLSFYFVAID